MLRTEEEKERKGGAWSALLSKCAAKATSVFGTLLLHSSLVALRRATALELVRSIKEELATGAQVAGEEVVCSVAQTWEKMQPGIPNLHFSSFAALESMNYAFGRELLAQEDREKEAELVAGEAVEPSLRILGPLVSADGGGGGEQFRSLEAAQECLDLAKVMFDSGIRSLHERSDFPQCVLAHAESSVRATFDMLFSEGVAVANELKRRAPPPLPPSNPEPIPGPGEWRCSCTLIQSTNNRWCEVCGSERK